MRYAILLILVLALLLTACQSSTPSPAETTVVEDAPTVQVPTPTVLSRGTSTPTQPVEVAPVSEDSPGCVARSPFPTPGPTEQSLFPPPGEKDWVKGPDSATVTFTEYSDFQ
jgi:hypothetical protein